MMTTLFWASWARKGEPQVMGQGSLERNQYLPVCKPTFPEEKQGGHITGKWRVRLARKAEKAGERLGLASSYQKQPVHPWRASDT